LPSADTLFTQRVGKTLPSGAHFVVRSVLVLGPYYRVAFALPALHSCSIETPEKQKRLDEQRLRSGWLVVPHRPSTMVNRWRRGLGARVVLGLANVVATCGSFGSSFEGRKAKRTRK
jgi:hypothetical protein